MHSRRPGFQNFAGIPQEAWAFGTRKLYIWRKFFSISASSLAFATLVTYLNRVRQKQCPLAPDKWFWSVDKWVINLTCPLDK